ncbi:hypothetical protein Y1Q_0005494 [Alligator mississippiensis]|uniref:Secreted protein n=1 Tax=Alligator mississippiensis TaxID=8496 RepID=A0A151MEP9_ALLMI|nr:hypothetical protein Y1Q_0005494 [Alligator mississippiensis]
MLLGQGSKQSLGVQALFLLFLLHQTLLLQLLHKSPQPAALRSPATLLLTAAQVAATHTLVRAEMFARHQGEKAHSLLFSSKSAALKLLHLDGHGKTKPELM